jgi:hypothetical protein
VTLQRLLAPLGSPGVPVPPPPPTTVPDFSGQSVSVAVEWANGASVLWSALDLPALRPSSRPQLLDNYLVSGQNPPPGSVVNPAAQGLTLTAREAELAPQAALAAPPPQVVCALTYGPIGKAKFGYRTRPRRCLFHKPGAPVDSADLVAASHLHWLHWGNAVAVGKGRAAENMVGLVPLKVRLTRPLTVCGHTVFTKARFEFPTVRRGYGRPVALDHSLGSC